MTVTDAQARRIWVSPASAAAEQFARIAEARQPGWEPSDRDGATLWVVDGDVFDADLHGGDTGAEVAFVASEFRQLPTMEWAYFNRALNAETIARWLEGRFGHLGSVDPVTASAPVTTEPSDAAAAAAIAPEAPRPAASAAPWLRNTDDAPRSGRATGASSDPVQPTGEDGPCAAAERTDATDMTPIEPSGPVDWVGPSVVDVMRAFEEIDRALAGSRDVEPTSDSANEAPWIGHRFRLRHWPNVARYGEGPEIAYACGQLVGRFRSFDACLDLGLNEATLNRILDDALAAGNLEIAAPDAPMDPDDGSNAAPDGALITGILARYADR